MSDTILRGYCKKCGQYLLHGKLMAYHHEENGRITKCSPIWLLSAKQMKKIEAWYIFREHVSDGDNMLVCNFRNYLRETPESSTEWIIDWQELLEDDVGLIVQILEEIEEGEEKQKKKHRLAQRAHRKRR